jgi:hypothetical protein
MNNTFFDNHYQIGFLIPFERQLTAQEAEIIARQVISSRKESFYQAWKSRPENKNWKGDIDAKKEELFIKKHRPNSEILVGDLLDEPALSEVLKGDPQPNK